MRDLKTKQNIEKIGKEKSSMKYIWHTWKIVNGKMSFLCIVFCTITNDRCITKAMVNWSDVGEDSVIRLNHYVMVYFIFRFIGCIYGVYKFVSSNVWCFLTAGKLTQKNVKECYW